MEKTNTNSGTGGLAAAYEPQHHGSGADYFTTLSAPVTKLDADQYMAEDLDGVTENLFGSGNLNFLLMQSGQTNDAIAMADPFIITGEAPAAVGGLTSSASFTSWNDGAGNGFNLGSADFSSDRAIADTGSSNEDSAIGHGGGFTASTLTSLEAASFVANSSTTTPLSAIDGLDGNGDDGESGTSGADGINGTDGEGTTIINVDNSIDVDIGDVLIDIDIGDIIVDLGDLTIVDLGDVTNLITTTITEIFNLTEVTNNITSIINNFFDNIFGDGQGLTLHLDAILSDLTSLNLDVLSGDTVTNLISEVIDLSPVTDLLAPITSGSDLMLVDLHSLISILDGHNEHRPGDTDLGIGLIGDLGGLNLLDGVIDVAFNPVEDLVGDIDILADLGLDLFNADTSAGDTDLTLGLGLDLVDHELLDMALLDTGLLDNSLLNTGLLDIAGDGLELNLDLVEDILGDIDLDIGAGADLLGQTADNVIDGLAGGSGDDTLLANVGDMAGDLVDDLAGGILDDTPSDGLLDGVTDILDGQILEDILGGDIADGGVDDILNGDVLGDLPVADILGGVLGDLPGGGDNPLGDLADNLLGGDVTDILDGQILEDVLGGDTADGGITDILNGDLPTGDLLGGLPLDDIGDNPLNDLLDQDLLGGGDSPDVLADADIGLLGNDIADIDQGALLDPLEPVTGDVDLDLGTGLDLLGDNETDNAAGDSDVSIDLDLDVAGIELPDLDFIDVPLDPVEDILGDIDLDINGAIDLLNADTSDGGIADLAGGNSPGDDIPGWPENTLPDAGDITGGLADALGSVLPDPVGGVAEGLGSLLGGSGGGADHQPHHGGLFGGLFG